ncbi:hypothetical protein OIU77_024725 [Salix suchowensis]|uniref:Uncharacterized protein n=1 Tax=Salix suchowensis TaxID=1278906 RepID=A0ABQ9BWP7_9ROSI|nr:hypothetical protein OIU77_024725 [Salix suchowensis]
MGCGQKEQEGEDCGFMSSRLRIEGWTVSCNWSLDWEAWSKVFYSFLANWRYSTIINQVMFALNHGVFGKLVVFEGDGG